ncbi:PHB depolymerase family esterase [Alkalilimnicola sp. S0819]|uniref:extracellular catalytic domain type 1 short-chain-length polyhydroxyalkanoate depolymerase n=1 Tax=Alkalilimnicola sp. S0819 TaxID=2613922 RepID=UPI0012625A0F|nr:PHB depolymerase family esterase [Alkalilimnicola sp. S0819]KAB7619743.1 PHB depolymerase family esterase [Alkalilimnicola sp. S0819]MPQ17507.1 PHB depolymerase family esterase [Alkalilimnicola sp. S0819]
MFRRLILALSLLAFGGGSAQAFQQVSDFNQAKSNPGNLKMYTHVPQTLREKAPLVLALHGCTQSASTYHKESGWSELADRHGFLVVYPEQNSENKTAQTGNPYNCFNWAGYYGARMAKGDGENASVMQMIEYMQERYPVDADKIYITGLSAGGGLTSMMLALYPDVFAGGAPMAGLPYHCANTVDDAYACMGVTSSFQPRTGAGCESGEACMAPDRKRSPQAWAQLARDNNGGYSGNYPRVLIWQGDKDQYVDDDNAVEIMKQFTALHGTDQTADVTGQSFNGDSKHVYREYLKGDRPVVGVVDVLGMKHGITIDEGTGEDQGGKAGLAMSYTHDFDVFSSYYTAKWWGLLDTQPENDRPVVRIESPTDGAHLSGTVEVSVSATDDDGIARVDIWLGDELLISDISAPYGTEFNAGTLADGEHVLRAVAVDASADAVSSEVQLTFSTGNDSPALRFTSPEEGAHLSGTVTFSVDASDRDGIARVAFYLQGSNGEQPFAVADSAPWQATLDVATLADGQHTVRAEAVDASAEQRTSSTTLSFRTGFDCQEWTTYNYYHALAGRARNVSLLWWSPEYRVLGSDEALGRSSWIQTTVRNTPNEGEFAKGSCR